MSTATQFETNKIERTAPAQKKSSVSKVITDVAPDQLTRVPEMKSFKFSHSLGNFPALSIPSVRKLTLRLLEEKRFDQVHYRKGGPNKTKNSDADSVNDVLETIDSLETAGAWLRLTRVDEINEEFGEISEIFYDDLERLYQRDIRSKVMKTFVTLFISSPNEITPYHIDHSWNFLLQIGGRKTVHLFDADDPRVVRPQDREGFYMKQPSITQNHSVPGIPYDIAPGEAVHHPVHAPHWVQNGPEVSVSLSFGLCLHSMNDDAKVHQVNFMLRKMGFNPKAPRQSKWRDSVKKGAINLISDRKQNSFDDVVFSGVRRLHRVMKFARLTK